jgi:hypothetical protein
LVGEVPVLELSPHTIPRYDCLITLGKRRPTRMLTVDVASSSTASSSSTNAPSVLSAMARILNPRIALTDGRMTGMYMDEAEDIVEECGTSAQWQD